MSELSHLTKYGEHCTLSENLESLANNHGDSFFTPAHIKCNLAKIIDLDTSVQTVWSESLLAVYRKADASFLDIILKLRQRVADLEALLKDRSLLDEASCRDDGKV